MKPKLILLLASLLIFAVACGQSTAQPTPTRFPLPSVPILPTAPILQLTVTASNQLIDSPATNVIDGSLDTLWNAGDGPEQWVMIDFGALKRVSRITLHVAQYPQGETIHQIWVGINPGTLTLVHEFRGITTDAQALEFTPSTPLNNIQFVKIITRLSPSWVAWKEIEIAIP
jgi:hypothetical protein